MTYVTLENKTVWVKELPQKQLNNLKMCLFAEKTSL